MNSRQQFFIGLDKNTLAKLKILQKKRLDIFSASKDIFFSWKFSWMTLRRLFFLNEDNFISPRWKFIVTNASWAQTEGDEFSSSRSRLGLS
jgi:hypothetical protein